MKLTFDPDTLELPNCHFIDGIRRNGLAQIEVRRPSDGRIAGSIPDGDSDLVDEAVIVARRALKESGWSTQSPRERGRVLQSWAALLERETRVLAQLEAACSTRPVRHAYDYDVRMAADTLKLFGEVADKYGGNVISTRRDNLAFIAAEPYGVVGAITPWNYPISIAAWKCGPALAAGNAILLKPSEMTPYSTVRMAELAIEAGLPKGLFNVVQGRGNSCGRAIVRHPSIDKVSFTGSTRTGAAIMADVADTRIKPVTLELGGKSPQIVFERVSDLSRTADCIVAGFTGNAGQSCVAGSRLIVHQQIAQPLLDAISVRISRMQAKPTWDDEAAYAPVISKAQSDRVLRIVDEALRAGAEVLTGGGLFEGTGEGRFHRPCILVKVDQSSPAIREEIFGPVLTVQLFDDEEEALALANDTSYGLAAGVHTADFGQALRATQRLEVGTVWVNRYGRSADMMVPTGGFKQSGIGKDLGREAFEANLRHKSVLMEFGR